MNPLERMKKIHIWLGTTSKTEEVYDQYFSQDENDSQYALDIGLEEYDEDFLGVIPLFNTEQKVIKLLNEIPIDSKEIEQVVTKAVSLGIEQGNAVFYLTDAQVEINSLDNKTYNDLVYVGCYKSSLASARL